MSTLKMTLKRAHENRKFLRTCVKGRLYFATGYTHGKPVWMGPQVGLLWPGGLLPNHMTWVLTWKRHLEKWKIMSRLFTKTSFSLILCMFSNWIWNHSNKLTYILDVLTYSKQRWHDVISWLFRLFDEEIVTHAIWRKKGTFYIWKNNN